jgi:protein-S-isoprenylcysteine O-methyltransferase Ste14
MRGRRSEENLKVENLKLEKGATSVVPLFGGTVTRKSVITVSIQLICIAALVVTGPVIPRNRATLALACAGVAVILWAVAAMGVYNVRVEPDVHEHARLVMKGPYGFVRHPMYTGGTLIALAWVCDDFSVVRLLAALVLFADFVVKMRYEETLLAARFSEYPDYMRRTKRLVPFLY